LDEKKPEYGLANPTVILTVYDRRGRSYRIQFGNKTPDKMEAYALVEGWRKPVVLTAWLLDDANKSPDDFRDKRLLVFRKEKVTKLALIYPDRRIICERKGKEEWQLKEPIRTAGGKGFPIGTRSPSRSKSNSIKWASLLRMALRRLRYSVRLSPGRLLKVESISMTVTTLWVVNSRISRK